MSERLLKPTNIPSDLTPEERTRLDEYNRQSIADNEKAYFSIKYVELLIFDIVPIDRRDEFVRKLRDIVNESEQESIRFVEKSRIGSLGGAWSTPLTIDKRKVPTGFVSAQILVGQCFSFSLYFLISAVVPDESEKGIRDAFMRSGLWSVSKKPTAQSGAGFSRSIDETEPTIRTLQRELQRLENRLSPISGNWPFLSILKDLVFGSQSTRIGNSDISGGLTIVRLTIDEKISSGQGYPTDIISSSREYLAPFLLCLYWSRLMIEISIPDWERKIDELNKKFQ